MTSSGDGGRGRTGPFDRSYPKVSPGERAVEDRLTPVTPRGRHLGVPSSLTPVREHTGRTRDGPTSPVGGGQVLEVCRGERETPVLVGRGWGTTALGVPVCGRQHPRESRTNEKTFIREIMVEEVSEVNSPWRQRTTLGHSQEIPTTMFNDGRTTEGFGCTY